MFCQFKDLLDVLAFTLLILPVLLGFVFSLEFIPFCCLKSWRAGGCILTLVDEPSKSFHSSLRVQDIPFQYF